MKNLFITISFSIHFVIASFSQSTIIGHTQDLPQTRYIGFSNNFPLFIRTNGVHRATFSTSSGLDANPFVGVTGDGLRILPVTGTSGSIDLFTGASTETYLRMGASGMLAGRNNRWEQWANSNGFWFNTFSENGRYIFNRSSAETGRIGTNNFWRVGLNASNLDANRRLEVVDAGNPQLRLTHTANGNAALGIWTDMQTTAAGHLNINPRNAAALRNVGINVASPASNLHVNADANNPSWIQVTNTTVTGSAATDGLRMGVLTDGTAEIRQQENRPMKLFTNSVERVHINAIVNQNPGYNRNGFVGLNNSDPRFHLDILTPISNSTAYSELILRARTAEDTSAYLSMINFGQGSGIFVPTLLARQSDNPNAALTTCGSITDNQDTSSNTIPVSRFFSARNYDPTNPSLSGPTLDRVNVIQNRRIFGWFNGVDQLMTMEANGYLGIGTTNPGNRLEINSDFYLPNDTLPGSNLGPTSPNGSLQAPGFGSPTGYSGLRFSDLKANSTPGLNPGFGVLAVDSNGDVIYVVADSKIGKICGDTADTNSVLTYNTEIPMGGFNFLFSGQDTTADRVGIGIQGCNPNAKLDVLQTVGNNGVTINAVYNGEISGFNNVFEGGFAVKGYAVTQTENECEALAAGGMFIAESNAFTYGVAGLALGNSDEFCETNNVGGYFLGKGTANSNIGVFAQAWITGSNDWAAYVNGPGLIMNGPWSPSDAQLKTNVQGVQNATQILSQLNPVSYNYSAAAQNALMVSDQSQFGLIAQELAAVLPELVKTTAVPNLINPAESGANQLNASSALPEQISVVNYTELIPILIAGFQEQNERINQLQSQLQACCTSSDIRSAEYENQPGAVVPVRLHTEDAPRLGQNIPNPFDVQTRIPVYLPVSVAKAEIIFYSNEGKIIQNQLLFDRGEFSVAADAETLASGIYSYTLYVDGKPVETKRMVKR